MEGEKKVAVVTGGNRGVGLAVVRALAEAEPEKMVVVMGARDPEAGARACEGLKMDNVVVQQLDVQDPASIARLATWLQSQFGGLDILVNNAGTSGTHMDKEALEKYNLTPKQVWFDIEASKKVLSNDHELSENCMDINYYGAKRMIEALSPLFKASSTGAHIINVSSRVGQLRELPNEALRQQFMDVGRLTQKFVDKTMEDFLVDFKEGKLEEKMWPTTLSAYKMSKIALNAYTRILAREFDCHSHDHKIYVNAVSPGYVATDMSYYAGHFTPQEAADGLVWVVFHDHDPPLSGQFIYQKKSIDF